MFKGDEKSKIYFIYINKGIKIITRGRAVLKIKYIIKL